jgi:hydrogenase-4 component E
MNGLAIWVLLVLGLGVVVVRRRSMATALVTAQALTLAALAASQAGTANEIAGAAVLGFRALALAGLFMALVSRTREARPVRAAISPGVRAGLAVGLALLLTWLVPIPNNSNHNAYQAVLALIAFGLIIAATRRATLFQVIGIVGVENGVALAALTLGGASSLVIEVGVTMDLALVAVVAGVFHERIFTEFGAGDTAALRSLRD